MHTLDLGEIEAVAAGSREKWWFKAPTHEDTQRIQALAALLSAPELERLYALSQDRNFTKVNNRLYVLLSAVAARHRPQSRLG